MALSEYMDSGISNDKDTHKHEHVDFKIANFNDDVEPVSDTTAEIVVLIAYFGSNNEDDTYSCWELTSTTTI